MTIKRTDRLNTLLREVISDVIRKEIRNPKVSELLTVTRVEITKDLKFAKVYISVIGSEIDKKNTLNALKSARGFISSHASKQVVMRYFPSLQFFIDDTVDKQMRISDLLDQIAEEKRSRPHEPT